MVGEGGNYPLRFAVIKWRKCVRVSVCVHACVRVRACVRACVCEHKRNEISNVKYFNATRWI